jgi:hypothetical protein
MDFFNFYIQQIPIPKIIIKKPEQQKSFVGLVDKILTITKDKDYLHNPHKQIKVKDLEDEIDQLVYKLYDLTPEEIAIVEGKNKLENKAGVTKRPTLTGFQTLSGLK